MTLVEREIQEKQTHGEFVPLCKVYVRRGLIEASFVC
jgi:hypothetical protein